MFNKFRRRRFNGAGIFALNIRMERWNNFKAIVLNVVKLVFAFVYNKPRELFSKKRLNDFAALLFNPDHTDELKAVSTAVGIFMGIIPIWGFQTLLAIFVAVALKLNRPLVIIFSLASFPPLMPLFIFLSYRTGAFITGNKPAGQNISSRLEQYIYGSVILAITAAIMTGLLTLAFLKLTKVFRQYKLTAGLKKAV